MGACFMTDPRILRSCRRVTALAALVILVGCGGGGGGGGEPADEGLLDPVISLGIVFRSAAGEVTTTPPFEDTMAVPPTLGAPLNTVIRFLFDGEPSGPFDQKSLPVYTTPADVHPNFGAPAGVPTFLAKGYYVLVVDEGLGLFAVEFRPFVPTAPIDPVFSADPGAVPGLLPGSVYTAVVSTALTSKITNLVGPGAQVQFGTTSNPAAYYPADASDDDPPLAVEVEPAEGTLDFFPGVLSNQNLTASGQTFPDGPSDMLVTFDRPVVPTVENLLGSDITGNGVLEPTFFLRTRATALIVAHTLPDDALVGTLGTHAAFAALSALDGGVPPAADGSDVVVHGGVLPGPTAAYQTTPSSLAAGWDPALVFALLPVEAAADRLTVFDHLLGDPAFASLSADAPAGLDTGLDDAIGLLSLADGRLMAFDRSTRRVVELLPTVVRDRPTPGDPVPGPPSLAALSTGDGTDGFASQPFPASSSEVLDLAQAPSGLLFALVRDVGAVFTRLQPLHAIDLDGDGAFDPVDGLPDDEGLSFDLPGDYVDVIFVAEGELLALDRTRDVIDRLDLITGAILPEVTGVAAFGIALDLLPGQQSPATALAVGFLDLDVDVSLMSNGPEGAVLHVEPVGLLPADVDLTLMQRNTFSSLYGTSAVNADLSHPAVPAGATALLTVHTSEPLAGLDQPIDDVFYEDFTDATFEDDEPTGLSPLAGWADTVGSGATSGGLRASVGVAELGVLGDFRPLPPDGFNSEEVRYKPTSAKLGDQNLNKNVLGFRRVMLDTDSQSFPLPDGSTPGMTQSVTVLGGQFAFHDFIIPEGVHVIVRGTRPLRIVATGQVQIDGLLDLSGGQGYSDESFNSGFLPVPGAAGGPGGGRGGDGHPTVFDPNGPQSIDQYATPERGQRGMGPVVSGAGQVTFHEVGGHGGLPTIGYDPNSAGYPKLEDAQNTEHQRPPGGGGGSLFFRGDQSHEGTGVYQVQSSSSWFPFSKCPTNDKIHDALYGNDENFWAGRLPNTPIQCVYMLGTPEAPERFRPGAPGGDTLFNDGDPSNDFFGPTGELKVLIGGQGGGGGGSRVDSMKHKLWSVNNKGAPLPSPPAPPFYPTLQPGIFVSATFLDAKGGGGGGGAGSIHIRSFGDIVIGRLGYIDATGGDGGGGELVANSTFVGGGGGGSGGVVILEAAGSVIMQADPGHMAAGFTDSDGDQGAAIDVSGGQGRDTRSSASGTGGFSGFTYEATRSDGGQGGFGLIQLQTGDGGGLPQIDEGAFAFARKRTMLKEGAWTGSTVKQKENDAWINGTTGGLPDGLRYIDMLHWRPFPIGDTSGGKYNGYTLNGCYPPIIPSATGNNGSGLVNEWPPGSGQFWADTVMTVSPLSGNVPVVRDPHPEFVMKSYLGWDPETFLEPFHQQGPAPGETWDAMDEIPLPVNLHEPDGTPFLIDVDGVEVFDPQYVIDRLPLIHPSITPVAIGSLSMGTSVWLDFHGVSLRMRDPIGRPPPFFEPFLGTWNAQGGALGEPIPNGSEGLVRLGAQVPGNIPARFVQDAGYDDPGLFPGLGMGEGDPPNPPHNDVKVDAPDASVSMANVVTDNASLRVLFQGAYALRPGSHVPDPESMTPWLADLTDLSGYPLVRFRVHFDLEASPGLFPFGADSMRPQIDVLRLRARY
jgi:hypothetical protein